MTEKKRIQKNKAKPALDFKGLDPDKANLLARTPAGGNSGVGCTKRIEPTGIYDQAECEYYIG